MSLAYVQQLQTMLQQDPLVALATVSAWLARRESAAEAAPAVEHGRSGWHWQATGAGPRDRVWVCEWASGWRYAVAACGGARNVEWCAYHESRGASRRLGQARSLQAAVRECHDHADEALRRSDRHRPR